MTMASSSVSSTRLETDWGQLLLLYACILCCLSYSKCVFFVMFISSNLSLRFFGYLVFGGIMCFVNSTAWSVLQDVRFTGVNSAKCYICFSCRYREMYVSIASMYLSQLISLFSCHFSASISVPSQLIDHATKLGHHCSGDKICYSRDALLSFNTSISSTSNSLCATINSLGIHASSLICIGWKSRRRNR